MGRHLSYGRLVMAMMLWLLIERGDVDKDDKYGQTPLIWAIVNEHDAVVRLLMKREDIDINPLIWAARIGHDTVVRLLVQKDDIDRTIMGEHHSYGRLGVRMRLLCSS